MVLAALFGATKMHQSLFQRGCSFAAKCYFHFIISVHKIILCLHICIVFNAIQKSEYFLRGLLAPRQFFPVFLFRIARCHVAMPSHRAVSTCYALQLAARSVPKAIPQKDHDHWVLTYVWCRTVGIYCHPCEQDLDYDFRNLQLSCVYL